MTGGYIVGPTLGEGEQPFPLCWEQSEDVAACVHPEWESVLVRQWGSRLQECIRCVECHAPRCGHSTDDDPCMRVRHHRGNHVYLSGTVEPVGGCR